MTKAKQNWLQPGAIAIATSLSILANTLPPMPVANAQETEEAIDFLERIEEDEEFFDQVTSVSQLSDIQPTDWAFQALQSLVERYGCIAGYPDGTYRGNRAMTRYEFAAGLNACLDRITELIAASTADLVSREDLSTLQRLQEEFAAELPILRGRVDILEARTAELEANRFSTTTKLNAEVLFHFLSGLSDPEVPAPGTTFENNPVFSYRIRFDFDTSFTGKDTLRIRLEAKNTLVGTGMAFLNFGTNNNGEVQLSDLWYQFPVGDNLRFTIAAKDGTFEDFAYNQIPSFGSSSSGALTFFGAYPFLVYPFTSSGEQFAAHIKFSEFASLDLGYYTRGSNIPTASNGLFNGDFGTTVQLNLGTNQPWDLGLIYTYTFQPRGQVTLTDTVSSPIGNDPFGEATAAHRFGIIGNWNITPTINLGGWAAYLNAEARSGLRKGDKAHIWTWAATLALLDIAKEGDTVGLIVGMPPKAVDVEGGPEDEDTSFLVELQYRFPISDNILITPGVFVVFDPDHDKNNDDVWVGVIRTTFKF